MIKRKIKKPMEAVIISKLIGSCREDMDRKIEILYRINSMLPKLQKLKILHYLLMIMLKLHYMR
jgi:hypothetical protein